MDNFNISGAYLASMRESIKDAISYVKFTAGTHTYTVNDLTKSIDSGIINISWQIGETAAGDETIRSIAYYDASNNVIMQAYVSIERASYEETVNYTTRLDLFNAVRSPESTGMYDKE